jgi:hypothetical protein
VKALQQISSIKLDGFAGPSSIECLLERDGIAPEIPVQTQCVAVAAYQRIGAEGAAQDMDRLAQGIPGVLGVMLRPEEREEGVAPVLPAGGGQRQVRE